MAFPNPFRGASHRANRPPPSGGSGRAPFIVERIGFRRHLFDDLYHFLLISSWVKLFAIFTVVFLAVNVIFGELYLLEEGSLSGIRPGSRLDAFFFSVQTISTVGYGGMMPQTLYANVISTLEAFLGLIGFALAAGLIFAKFSRPTARILFSHSAVVGEWEGAPALMIRMANARNNQVVDARVTMHLLRDAPTSDGSTMRRFFDMALVRDRTPIFALTWTAVHLIEEGSPLHGMTPEELERTHAQVFLTIIGTDESFMAEIHARRTYRCDEFAWNSRFCDVLIRKDDWHMQLDYTRIHDVEPLE